MRWAAANRVRDQEAGAGDFSLSVPFAGATGDEVISLNLILDHCQLLNLVVGFDSGDYTDDLSGNKATIENALLSFEQESGGRA